MIAVAYLRVSTDEQSLGVDVQRAAIERWASEHGATIASWHQDLDVCGATPLDERLGLMDAIAALKEHGATALVILKRDRLARDTMIAAMIDRLVEKAGATVEAADGVGNGSTPEALMIRGIMDVFAMYERALIRSRTKAALAAKKAKGERVGSIPLGKVVLDGKLVDGPDAPAVERARSLRAGGMTYRAISDRLVGEGHRRIWRGTLHRACKVSS